MQGNSIGQLIKRIREERKLSQRELCQGLCSVQKLSNIEAGERVPDVFLFEHTIQRLGLSPDEFETVLFDDEYKEILLRDCIEEKIELGCIKEAEEMLITNYFPPDGNSITQQYFYQIKAILSSLRNDHVLALCCLEKAIRCTQPAFSLKGSNQLLLGTREIELLCMKADEYIQIGEINKAKETIGFLCTYLESTIINNLELVKTYPKVTCLYMKLVNNPLEMIDGIKKCEKALELLIETDSIVCMPEIMEMLTGYYKEMGLEKRQVHLEKQLDSLKKLYEEFDGCIFVTKSNLKWFKESHRKEYLLCKEMIRGERVARGIKRESLIEGIYEDLETLAKIENGYQNPSKKSYEAIMKKLGMFTEKYYCLQISEGDEISEIKKEIRSCFIRHDYESAKLQLTKLKLLIDSAIAYSRQYIARQEGLLAFELKQIDASTFCEKEIKALKETYAGDIEKLYRIPTMEERYIFNNLAISYWQMGRNNKGIELLRNVLNCYEGSAVTRKYHFRSLAILYRNYLRILEESNCVDEALYIADKEIRMEIDALRAGGLDIVSSELMCLYEKMSIDEEHKKKAIEKYLRYAFYISDLYNRKTDNKIYDKYYRENIDPDIQWYE